MKVIPVIDILSGIAVHAVRGRRREYQPLQSILAQSVNPLEVAWVFKRLGFHQLYIADLDAITKGQINFQLLKSISDKTGLKLMVDTGVTNLETAKKLIENGVSKVVIGTETLQTKDFVSEAVKVLGNNHAIVSLDLKGDKVLAKLGIAGCIDPLCLMHEFKNKGLSGIIILDLNRVGSEEGVNVDLVTKALEVGLNVYVGGGVRDINDLIRLKDLGISGVLVATALHSDKISIEKLRQNGLL